MFIKRLTIGAVVGILMVTYSSGESNLSTFDILRDKCVNKGQGEACFKLGEILRKGTGDEGDDRPDFYLAIKYFKKGCKLHHADSCHEVGSCYSMGKALPKSTHNEIKFLKKACEYGNKESCEKYNKIK